MPENLQRIGFLAVVPELLRRDNVDPGEVLASVGLGADGLDDPEGMISYATMGRLLRACAERTACPHFGLRVGERAGAMSLGLISEMMRNAPSLGAALRDLVIHQHRHARGAIVFLLDQGEDVLFGYAIYQADVEGARQIFDGAAAIGLSIVRNAIGATDGEAPRVLLSRPRPPDVDPYRQVFRARISFDQEATGVLIPRAWLDRPVAGADPERRARLIREVDGYWQAGDYDVVTVIRRAIAEGLLTGEINGEAIANRLGFSRRTLHRRLDAQGVSFQSLLNETRFEFGKQLLANTRLGVSHISLVLRYADPSVFTRAFARWSGLSPSGWRNLHGIDPRPSA